MRANRLPAAAAADTHRLEDLKTEAEFLCYDALVAACDESLEALERARPTARCLTFHVNHFHDEEGMQLNLVEVDVRHLGDPHRWKRRQRGVQAPCHEQAI